jgi:four helix bundle protein
LAIIAEGASRKHKAEYLHFLYIAKASMAETEYFLHIPKRPEYLANEEYRKLEDIRSQAAKTLHGLINSVEKDR